MSLLKLGAVRGSALVDVEGSYAGTIESTYPFDGGTPEFGVVRVGHFGDRVLVPLEAATRTGYLVQVPYTRVEIEDSPTFESTRYLDDALSRSRGYWATLDTDGPSNLAPLPLT